jgi:hypothetical protein
MFPVTIYYLQMKIVYMIDQKESRGKKASQNYNRL